VSFTKSLFQIFIIAALLRTLFAFGFLGAMPLTADALSYANDALDFLKNFSPERFFFWPPGNSLLIALFYKIFGVSDTAPRILTILLGALTCILTAILARQVFNSERTATISGWIAAFYPSSIIMAGQATTMQPTLLIMLALAILLFSSFKNYRLWKISLISILLGFGCLIRPSTLSVIGVLIITGLFLLYKNRANTSPYRRWMWGIPVATAIIGAIIVPVMNHNAHYGAGWTISTNNELNFLFGNNPYTPHYKTSHFGQRALDSLKPEETAYFRKFIRGNQTQLTLKERRAVSQEAWRYILKNPHIFALRSLNRIRAFWGPDYAMSRGIQLFYGLSFTEFLPVVLFEAGGYVLVMLLAVSSLLFLFKSGWSLEIKLLLLLTASYQLPYIIAFSAASYHFPVMGYMMVFAAFGVEKIMNGHWGEMFLKRRFVIAAIIFLVIQIEYAYFIIRLA